MSLTENPWTLESARAWRLAALADGWTEEPTYTGHPVEQDATLKRDGWQAHVSARPAEEMSLSRIVSSRAWADVSVWGPDRLAVEVPVVYDWPTLLRGLTLCSRCGREGETVRLAFADRVCPDCRAKLAPVVETRGWAD